MRILFVHNQYGITSGEEIMLKRIMSLLTDNGHKVEIFSRESKDIDSLFKKSLAFFSGVWSFSARKALKDKIDQFQPDIVQVQNLYPLISPSILPMLHRMGIPVVMRLSNYRLICPSGIFLSHGDLCERCRGGKEYNCVVRNCERNWFKSFGYALRNWVARIFGLYIKNITQYYAQTSFQKDLLVSEGFFEDRIDVIPNMVSPTDLSELTQQGSYVGFIGRMSPEKGVEVFLEAAKLCPDIPFKIAGDQGKYQSNGALPINVELLGHLDGNALENFYRQSRCVVVPSLCYEGFPGVIIEAMCHGKPVLASRIGGLPEIVDDKVTGILFQPGNSNELAGLITSLWEDEDAQRRLGEAGRKKVSDKYLPDIYYERLMAVYEKAINDTGPRPSPE